MLATLIKHEKNRQGYLTQYGYAGNFKHDQNMLVTLINHYKNTQKL